MKFTVATPKPRNPLVAAALRRSAGVHRRSNGSLRQQAARALQRALQPEHPPHD